MDMNKPLMGKDLKKKAKLTTRQVRLIEESLWGLKLEWQREVDREAERRCLALSSALQNATKVKLDAAIAHLDSIRGHLVAMSQGK